MTTNTKSNTKDKARRVTYSLDMYLNKMKSGDIRNNGEVQRSFNWNKGQVNELIYSVLTNSYIPDIIVGEDENGDWHIADGGQRSTSYMMFRYMNYKITSSIENSIITYRKRIRDDKGHFNYVDEEFDIKNKTYDMLPDELKKVFDEYQVGIVVLMCDSKELSRYIKRFNNHIAMNQSQKAFTCIPDFAPDIRTIIEESLFFCDCTAYSESQRNKGYLERIIIDSVVAINFIEDYNKNPIKNAKFLNENGTLEIFNNFRKLIDRLGEIVQDDAYSLFTTKNTSVWLTVFDKFTKHCTTSEADDVKFYEFLKYFIENSNDEFEALDSTKNTKDKSVIVRKIELVEKAMSDFFTLDQAA